MDITKTINNPNHKKDVFAVLILVVGIVVIGVVLNIILGGRLLTLPNINAIFVSAIIASFCAWGYCLIFALNFMDMSIGAAIVLVIYGAGELGNRIGPIGVLIGGIGVGVLLMMINFNLFTWSKIPTWVAGLGLCLMYEAIAAYYAHAMQLKGGTIVLLDSINSTFGHAPGVYILFAIGIIGAYILYNRTSFGLNMRSIGDNPAVAKSMGINITRTILLTGLACGIFIGCAGLIRESYSMRVYAMSGLLSLSVIFPPMATVFLAQILSKWINIIIVVPFCAVFIYICYNILSIVGVPAGTLQEAVLGSFVIIFGIIAQRGTKGVVK